MLDGKRRRHGKRNTGLDTMTKRKEGGLEQLIVGINTNAIKMIATKEDCKNDINSRVE